MNPAVWMMPAMAQPPSALRYKFDFPSSLFSCQKFSPLFHILFSSSFICGVNRILSNEMKWKGMDCLKLFTAWELNTPPAKTFPIYF